MHSIWFNFKQAQVIKSVYVPPVAFLPVYNLQISLIWLRNVVVSMVINNSFWWLKLNNWWRSPSLLFFFYENIDILFETPKITSFISSTEWI